MSRVALLVSLALAACGGEPPAFRLVRSRELGVLPQAASIKGRDGGYSGLFGGRSLWLYGDTILASPGEDGTSWRNNTASSTTDLDASDGIGGFVEEVDGKGAPRELYPQTAEERAFNTAHSEALQGKERCAAPCNARYAIWPGPLVEDAARKRALLVYTAIYAEPGEWNFRGLGTGIATWAGEGQPVLRPEVRPGTAHPTLLFQDPEPSFGSAAAITDGQLHLLGCHGTDKGCRLARAPLERVLELAAWSYYAGDGRWSARAADAVPLFSGMDMTSVHWNAHLGRWLAIYSPPFENLVAMRSAPALTGPWSEEVVVVEALAPASASELAYSGLGHGEYAREGGRLELVTYYRSPAPWQGELRVVELELDHGAP